MRPANVHVVAPGESLIGIARRSGVSLSELARANNISPYTRLKVGDRIDHPRRPQGCRRGVRRRPSWPSRAPCR